MLGKIFGVFCTLSLLFGVLCGRLPEVAASVPDGAQRAVEVTLTLLGMMCLWGGVMQVLLDAGIMKKIAGIFVYVRIYGKWIIISAFCKISYEFMRYSD